MNRSKELVVLIFMSLIQAKFKLANGNLTEIEMFDLIEHEVKLHDEKLINEVLNKIIEYQQYNPITHDDIGLKDKLLKELIPEAQS